MRDIPNLTPLKVELSPYLNQGDSSSVKSADLENLIPGNLSSWGSATGYGVPHVVGIIATVKMFWVAARDGANAFMEHIQRIWIGSGSQEKSNSMGFGLPAIARDVAIAVSGGSFRSNPRPALIRFPFLNFVPESGDGFFCVYRQRFGFLGGYAAKDIEK